MKKRLALITPLVLTVILLVATALMPSPASAAGGYSRTITIDHTKAQSVQTDFPVLISLSDATLKDTTHSGHVASSDGGDIYFTDSSNTVRYPYEIEKYDGVNGTLVAWVRVPSLSSSTDTVLKIWYGGGASPSPGSVWDSNFKGVWHMAQVSAPDSTSNSNNGTGNTGVSSTSGQLGGADSFDGSTGYINCGAGSSLNFAAGGSYTWEAWVNPTVAGKGGMGIIGKCMSDRSKGYEIFLTGGGKTQNALRFQGLSGGTMYMVDSTDGVVSNTWTHIAIVYDTSANVSMYLNGVPVTTTESQTTADDDTSDALYIGYRRSAPAGPDSGYFTGIIDEVKFSTTARSADWIKTEYNNQSSPSSFYTVSAEKVNSTTGTQLSASSITLGGSVTDTATVSGSSTTPTGTVDFQVSSDNGANWATFEAKVALSSGQATSGSYTPVAVGNYLFRAVYGGDARYSGSQSADTPEPLTVTMINPLPALISIDPTSKTIGVAGFIMTVNGSNFVSTSVVRFNGSDRATTFINDARLTAAILESDLTAAGTFNITVFSPTPGGGESNAQTFTVSPVGGAPPNPTPVTLSQLITETSLTLDASGTAQVTAQLKTLDGKVSLDIPAGTKLFDAQGKPLTSLSANTVGSPPAPPSDKAIVLAYDFGPDGVTFNPAITIKITYDQKDIPEGADESDIVLAYYDGTKWVNLTTTIDTKAHAATASIPHFTQFALLVELPAAPPPAAPAINWPVIGGIIAAVVVVVLLFFLLTRRRA